MTAYLPLLLALALAACRPLEVEPARGVALETAFPDHPRWRRPLWFGALEPGGPWHAVAEQGGRIHVFLLERDGTHGSPSLFLDLSDEVTTRGNEQGLLGLAFHPRFEENRRVFVYLSAADRDVTRLVELRAEPSGPDEPPRADPESARVLLEVEQPWENHNGGELVFGPDGMLYLGVGDGGSAGDPREAAQDTGTLLGKILRIDVDREQEGRRYAIPPDNPFAGVARTSERGERATGDGGDAGGPGAARSPAAGARPEIWALGLRNPWRFSFDPATGALWCGDVGQNAWEEVDVVERGGNYGWPRREGFAEFRERGKRGPGALADPRLAYPHREGQSVTGGFVYRGERVPALRGRYVFADYQSGRAWGVDAADPEADKELLARFPSVASFGVDAWGELYLCSFDRPIARAGPAR